MRPTSLLFLLAACSDPGASTVAAQVQDAPATTETPAAEAPAAEAPVLGDGLAVRKDKSNITFVAAKAVGEHPVVVHDYEGRVQLDGDQVSGLAFVAQMASVEADHPKLTTHLKDGDFFDVGEYPTSSFRSTAITEGSDRDGFTHTVTGELTVKGIAKTISFPAKLEVTDAEVTAATDFSVDRTEWGITYPGMKDNLIQDTVRMEIRFTAERS